MDTIFAPITAKGKCSVYVVRISGIGVKNCLARLGIKRQLKHREVTLCVLRDGDAVIDESLVAHFESPNSFTGENVCEISLHCSGFIIQKVFYILSSVPGVRFAEPGEFSKRAFLNGKMDLTAAESIVDLINAETELQHRVAMQQLQGKNSTVYNMLRNDVIELSSLIEAFIDFPEEDIPDDIADEIVKKIALVRNTIVSHLSDGKVGERIKCGFYVAIIGEPNVGKSSLLNYLANNDAAIVSDIAGTTRDVIEVRLDLGGIPVILCDTAGIRDSTDAIEAEGIKRAINRAKNADIKILMLSANNTCVNKQLLDLIDDNTIVLVNKIDLGDMVPTIGAEVIKISVTNKINLDTVLTALQTRLENIVSPNINTIVTNERYRAEMEQTLQYLDMFDFHKPIEINAENIRLAAKHLGNITGKVTSEEIIDNIFSKFCIGK